MKNSPVSRVASFAILICALLLSPASRAQDGTTETKGINSGNYNIQQSMEAGYRGNWVNGDQATYDTFVNLAPGFRLFDYSLDMRSLDHNGLLFDNLNFVNFGYGGDPIDVTRLRIEKNKWYDFRGLFRRDFNDWNWRLLANPLNPASSVVPTPILSSPHALKLVRRMQDYDLTLLPQSKIRVRLGYSRNVNEGPAFTTLDGGTEPLFNQNFKVTTNAYRMGVDFRVLPRTTLSYDQFLTYFKQDTVTFDQVPQTSPLFNNGNYQFLNPSGAPPTPVDLGIVWTASATGGAPCSAPIINPATTPQTVKPACNGFFNGTFNGVPLPAYNKSGRGRNFMPTERFSFQSSYFHHFEMSGSIGYSSGDNTVNDFLEAQNGLATRTAGRGSIVTGPADAKRVSVNADWSGVYSFTDKLRLVDAFRYENWRIPGIWTETATNLFAVPPPAPPPVLAGLQLPISTVVLNPAGFAVACPGAPFNQVGCPQHSSNSLADFENQVFQRFLGQRLISNTIQLQYDFNRRLTARIGYQYSDRVIADFSSIFDVQEIYFPGGASGNAGNHFLAARADCAVVAGALPPNCTQNADGSITEVGLDASSDTARNLTTIHENTLLFGITARPIDKLRITADFGFGYYDNTFTRTAPRQLQTYKIHANYRPKTWATIDGQIDIHENRDNVFTVNNLEHDRTYGFTTVLTPNPNFSVDFGYTYVDYYSQIGICYDSSVVNPGVTTTLCPNGAPGTATLGATSFYSSTNHYVYGDFLWKVVKRVTVGLGFGGSFVRGNSIYFNQPQFAAAPAPALGQVSLNLLTPTGTLDFNYLKPHGLVTIDVYKGLSYKMSWDYYGYNAKGPTDPAALAPVGARDFNGSVATFAFRYAF